MRIIAILIIYSIIGFGVNKLFFNKKLYFNIPLGFIATLSLFQIVAIPFLFLRGNFIHLLVAFLSIFIPIVLFILFRYGLEYLENIKRNVTDKTYLLHLLIIALITPLVVMLTISEVDQMLYSSQIISTLKTNQIYFSDGTRTAMHSVTLLHQMESFTAFNTMWIKLFSFDHINYVFNVGRILEMFIIIGSFGIVNQLYFDSKKSNLILATCGLLGLNILSATPFSVDEYVLLFSGTTGTLYMFVLLGPILMMYFKVEKHKELFFLLFLIFTFATTYTFIPIMIFTALILGIINKNGRLFYLTSGITSLFLIFYFYQFIWILIIAAIICFIFAYYDKLYKCYKLLITIYIIVIISCIIYGGFSHLLGLNGNLTFYLVIPLLYFYYKSKKYNQVIFTFISMFLVFNICFSSMFEHQEFAFMIVNTRSSIFLLVSYLIICILDDFQIIKYIATLLSVAFVILYAIIGVPNEYTRNVSEYIRDYQKYGSYRSTLIGNKDEEELIKYPFELNSDLYFYDFTGPDRMDKFDDSIVHSLNKYVGVVNIFMNSTDDYCVQTTDCYIVVSKFYVASDGYIRMLTLPVGEYLVETEKYYLLKGNNMDDINMITESVERLKK